MRIWFVHEGTGGTPFLSTKGHEGTRRTATATHLSTEDTEGRGELQRRLQLPFVHGGPRRATKNFCNGNTFVHGGHGTHLGRGELQRRLQLPFVHEGPRRNTKNCNGNTFVHGGHGGPRRTATATATSFCPRRAAKGHEELQRQHICPRRTRRAAENCNGDCNFLLSTKGREGTRRTFANDHNLVCHEGPRRTPYLSTEDMAVDHENCNGDCKRSEGPQAFCFVTL